MIRPLHLFSEDPSADRRKASGKSQEKRAEINEPEPRTHPASQAVFIMPAEAVVIRFGRPRCTGERGEAI